jgi:hypothetical protein
MFFPDGMRASELIKLLEKKIKEHGDCKVYSGGTDYPEGVEGVRYEKKGNAYVPKNSFYI